ncbi:LAQU0S03e08350g1_1 [Lachancea quebecensis]|uniref:LAQU0S03e08350g1_1 n=1 Tax=Lachancea quebecensis TaxID=1654605 RepID=A0A0P1KQ48_9SACH|nr:LAQU0S03e08350g1_1 [Lachancea quebecensis]
MLIYLLRRLKGASTETDAGTQARIETPRRTKMRMLGRKHMVLALCLVALALTLFLAALDIVIVITLYDTISEKFKDYGSIGWLVTGYSLSSALFTLLWGRMSSLLGLKTCLMLSVLIFEIGSLIVAVANSMGMIIAGRVVAGVGGSGIQSLVFVIGTSMVSERSRGMVITVLTLAFVAANAAGPVLGGALTEHASWRWCFYINLPIGGAAALMLFLSYNPSGKPLLSNLSSKLVAAHDYHYSSVCTRRFWTRVLDCGIFRFDLIGFALSSAGFVLILLGLTFGGNKYSWSSGTSIAYLTVGPVLILVFCIYDFLALPRMARLLAYGGEVTPLVPWSVISKPGVFASSFANFFVCFGYNMQIIYLVQFYQIIKNQSPTDASMHMWAYLVPSMVVIIALGHINKRFGIIKPIAVVGAACGVIGAGLLTLQKGSTTLGQTIGYCLLSGAGFSAVMQSSILSAQVQVDKTDPKFRQKFIEVTTLNNFFKVLGISFGGIIATLIFSTSLKNDLATANLNIPSFASADELIVYRSKNFDGTNSPLANLMVSSIRKVFFGALGCQALAFLFAICMSNKRLELKPKPPAAAVPELASDMTLSDHEKGSEISHEPDSFGLRGLGAQGSSVGHNISEDKAEESEERSGSVNSRDSNVSCQESAGLRAQRK